MQIIIRFHPYSRILLYSRYYSTRPVPSSLFTLPSLCLHNRVRYLLARVPPCCYFELCIAVSCYYVPWTGGINKTFIGNVTSGLVSIRIYREYDNVREHVHAFEIRTWKFENWNLFREYLFRTLTILNLVSLIIYSLFFFKQFKYTWKSCNNNNGNKFLREFFISSLYIFFFSLMWKIPS